MKVLGAIAVAMTLGAAGASFAGVPLNVSTGLKNETVEHSGGCRKSSPAGQCCHAGSRPYHCH